MIARRHFILPINPTQSRDDRPPPTSLFLLLFFPLHRSSGAFGLYGREKEEKKSDGKGEAQRLRGRKEGRKEGSKHEEGVLGEVSRGRGAISRLSIMEPVRSYREPAAGEEPAFHPTNLS